MTDESNEQSPFTRPGFIAAAIVVALVVILGVVLAVTATRAKDPTPAPVTSGAASSQEPTSEAAQTDPPAAGEGSICGLPPSSQATTLTKAPEATWEYQGTTAYPTSAVHGPARTTPEGVRYCFSRSLEGALVMAANALVQGSDAPTARALLEHALSEGPYRDSLLAIPGTSSSSAGTRMRLEGFRVLDYSRDAARIDLGVSMVTDGRSLTASGVYDLVWQGGDWKLNAGVPLPLDVALIPNLAGYVPWGE